MIRVDSSHLPLVLIEYEGRLTMAELNDCLAEFDRLLDRGERYVSISDISQLETPGPELLRRQARWFREREQVLGSLCIAAATIAPSAIARGLLKALSWLHPMPLPQTVVSTFDEAFDFVEDKLKQEHRQLPASAVQLRQSRRRIG
jgi:hypothetical protein